MPGDLCRVQRVDVPLRLRPFVSGLDPDGKSALRVELDITRQHVVAFGSYELLLAQGAEDDVSVTVTKTDETGAKSVRNLPGVHVLAPDQLNTYDVLRSDDVVFSVEALNAYIAANTAKTTPETAKSEEVSA